MLLVSKDAYMRCAAAAPQMRNRHATDVAGCSDALQRMWLDVAMRCDGCGCSFLTTAEEAEAMKGISWLRTLDIMKVCQRWACCVRCMLCAQSTP